MAIINFILQAKGGVGKSIIASILAQYYQENNIDIACFDTDQISTSFAKYEALNVKSVELMGDNKINPNAISDFFNQLLELDKDVVAVIDNGASSFIPICSYIIDNQIIARMKSNGHKMVFHSILTGGQAQTNCLDGLSALFANFPDVPIVIWQNQYFGKIEINGKSFEESNIFKENMQVIKGLITIKARQKETFDNDMSEMLQDRLIFPQAIKNPDYGMMPRQRLSIIWDDLKQQLELMNL